MALGSPDIGTGSFPSWFSQYETDISQLLQRLSDNTNNEIDAKDVRDSIWTLYSQIQTVASQSLTQSFSYTLGTPSTIGVGGISSGSTFSGISFQDFLDTLLLPYVPPNVQLIELTNTELEFGQITPTAVNFIIDVGSSPLSATISFISPSTPLNDYSTTGSDPESGSTTNNFTPTFSTSASIVELNTVTMSFSTLDSLTFSATASLEFKHRKYYGPIDLSSIGGFTPSSTSSIFAVSTFIDDTAILGLSFSELTTDFVFSEEMYFATGSHFTFAYPSIFGNLPDSGFYVHNIFSTGFTNIRSSVTFSNQFSYQTPYDLWISNYPFNDCQIKVKHE